MQDTLLVEILTEELPPKLLLNLSNNFSDGIFNGLEKNKLLTPESKLTSYVTPRRLALSISSVLDSQAEIKVVKRGPSVSASHDDLGKITPALSGFARSCGVTVDDLQQRPDSNGVLYYTYKHKQLGQSLGNILIKILQNLLPKIQAPKMMRWGAGNHSFVRPVHNFFMLFGKKLICESGELLGLQNTSAETLGHRFLSNGRIKIPHANDYEKILSDSGHVIVSFKKRKQLILDKLHNIGKREEGNILQDDSLLNEITALVEYPEVYAGKFNKEFLDLPQECLILSMKQHQKYFPLFDNKNRLLPRFLIVSNIKTNKSVSIVKGNERVLQARLADAKFFFDQDRNRTLASRIEDLSRVVYHSKLGMLSDRVERIAKIAQAIGLQLGGKEIAAQANDVALLAKTDLLTNMVGEFPELQGVMGRYYAKYDGISNELAFAIEDHYKPRFSGDSLPRNMVGICVALADKFETIAGMFGVGERPSGDKDPFALRRHAFGIVRILVQKKIDINLHDLVCLTQKNMPEDIRHKSECNKTLMSNFILDRARSYFADKGNNFHAIESVINPYGNITPLAILSDIIPMAGKFLSTEEGRVLANANKRITNILKKSGWEITCTNYSLDNLNIPDTSLFESDVEVNLWNALQKIGKKSEILKSEKRFSEALNILVKLVPPVKEFFEKVLVNTEDKKIRENRFLLLQYGRVYMNQVADLSLMVS